MSKLPITVVILTFNEEVTIQGCLESVQPHFGEVIVLDSLSTDNTQELVKTQGARLETRPFDNYAAQRRHALDDLKKEFGWVFFLDADERVSQELLEELSRLVERGNLNDADLYRLRRKDHFLGRWIKRTSGYPTWFGRLCKVGAVTIEREINEEYLTDGPVGFLESHLLHFPFMKGLGHWFDRHNRYSSMEAEKFELEHTSFSFKRLASKDPANRRKELKALFYRLPCRPLIAFLYLYFLRLGFLDGRAGFLYCCLRSYYEFMINIKRREIRDHVRKP